MEEFLNLLHCCRKISQIMSQFPDWFKQEINQLHVSPKSDEAKAIIAKTFDKWGFTVS